MLQLDKCALFLEAREHYLNVQRLKYSEYYIQYKLTSNAVLTKRGDRLGLK